MRNNTANCEVRKAAREAGVCLWQIASRLGIGEATMTRKMRVELSSEEKAKVLSIIEELRAEQEGE